MFYGELYAFFLSSTFFYTASLHLGVLFQIYGFNLLADGIYNISVIG